MLTVRVASVHDLPVIRELIWELAAYEKCSGQVRITEADLSRNGFGERPEFRILLAELQGVTAGFAFFFNYYSTWRGAGLYLEDLFVRPEYRGRGVAKTLVANVASLAERENRGFIRWAVLDWNEPAIAFYRKLGADFLEEWTTLILEGERLRELTRELPTRIEIDSDRRGREGK
jgi:GNAT superfamily N-acetyltransferase